MASYGTISPPPRSPAYARYQAGQHRDVFSTNTDTPSAMHVHGQGALSNLIKNQAQATTSAREGRRGSIGHRDEEEGGEQHGRRSLDVGDKRLSAALNTPQMRSMRLIGNNNPRYQWEQYWKTEEELKKMKKPL